MHYRNGREAQNGDQVVSLMDLDSGNLVTGKLRDAVPGDDYCNGYIQTSFNPSNNDPIACMCDCLHMDDLKAILAEKGLDKRPEGM